jgi:hypothetical protein
MYINNSLPDNVDVIITTRDINLKNKDWGLIEVAAFTR